MKILALEKEIPVRKAGNFTALLEAEAQAVWHLYQRDILREIYFRADRSDAVLVLECSGVDEARKILEGLPLVREGLIEFELISLKPYPGFSRLFKEHSTQQ